MKRSTLYGRAERAFRADIRFVERKLERNKKRASRTIGQAKVLLDDERDQLIERLAWLNAELKITRDKKLRAARGECATDAYAMPEGYMRPSDVTNN